MQTFNGKELQNCYSGSQQIDKITYGDKVIWENFKIIDLGVGQTFNIKNYTSRWSSLTVDNFFCIGTSNQATLSGSETGDVVFYVYNGWDKSYSNGSLTFRIKLTDGDGRTAYGSVHAVLVEKRDKLVSLGSGTSFNVRSYPNYADFTYKNFLMLKPDGNANNGVRTPGSWNAYTQINGSYSGGVFSTNFHYEYNYQNSGSRTENDKMIVYLYPKKL